MKTYVLAIALLVSPLCLLAQQDQTIQDKDINVVEFNQLKYPPLAQAARIEGVAVIRVKLDSNGKVTDTEVISGNPLLVLASVDSAKKWVFEPNAQKAAVLVFDFRIEGVCGNNNVSQMFFRRPNIASIIGCLPMAQPQQSTSSRN